MLLKRATNLQVVCRDISADYLNTQVKTGDDVPDISSVNRPEMPLSVASLIKGERQDVLFNGHNGIKAKNINLKEELANKNLEEYVFARVRAIDACGYEKKFGSKPPEGNNEDLHGANDNSDYFSVEELLREKIHEGKSVRAFETFVGVPFFTNHKNDNVEEARGRIINAFYDLDEHCVYCDVRIDAKMYPKLARGVKEGYISDVSMGTAVEYSVCSICGNKAAKSEEYCTHIKNAKGKKFGGQKCYEINHGLKFIEISAVTDGACENCKVDRILQPDELLKAANSIQNKVSNAGCSCNMKNQNKTAAVLKESFDDIKMIRRFAASKNKTQQDMTTYEDAANEHFGKIATYISTIKTASKEDLQALYDALQKLKDVTIKIIKSEDVDYEFVEDLSGVLADLQNLIVDLAEAGFGDVPDSSTGGGEGAGAAAGVAGGAPPEAGGMPPEAGAAPEAAPPAAGGPAQGGGAQSQGFAPEPNPLKGLASTIRKVNILTNKYSNREGSSGDNKELDSIKIKNLLEQRWNTIMSKEKGVMNSTLEINDGDYSLKVAGTTISAYHNGKKVQETTVDQLPKALAAAYKENQQETAEVILRAWRDGLISQAYAKNPPPQFEVQERQLEGLKTNFDWKRKDDYEEELSVIEPRLDNFEVTPETGNTEILLDGSVVNTGEDKFNRKNAADTMPVLESRMKDEKRRINDEEAPAIEVLERRLESDKGKYTTQRWTDDQRGGEEIPVTERQFMGDSPFQNAEKDRIGTAIMEVQEGQLSHKRQGQDTYDTGSNMSVAEVAADRLIKAAAKAVIDRGLTPHQMTETLGVLVSDYKGCFSDWKQAFTNSKIASHLNKRMFEKTASTSISKKEMATVLLDRLVSSYSKDSNLYDAKILAQAARTLSDMPDTAESAIKAEVDKTLKRIMKAASGQTQSTIKENSIENAVKQVAYKTAGIQDESEFDSHDVYFAPEDIDNMAMSDPRFNDRVKEAVAEILSENDILATSNTVEIEKIAKAENGLLVATTKVFTPSGAEAKLAAMKQVLKKIAQGMPQGTGAGMSGTGADGAAPAGGPGGEMGATPPPAGGGPDDPGVGALSTPPSDFSPEDGMGEDGIGEDSDEEGDTVPKFPGQICPACGKEDIENVDDHYVCKSCKIKFKASVDVSILNPDKIYDSVGGGEDEMPVEEGAGGEETAMSPMSAGAPPPPTGNAAGGPAGAPPAGMAPPMASGIPTLIVMSLHPANMLKTANTLGRLGHKGEPVAAGHRCPNCTSTKVYFDNDKGVCTACGTDYTVKLARKKSTPHIIEAEIEYVASKRTAVGCESCQAASKKLTKKLASLAKNQQIMIKEAQLETDSEQETAKIIMKHRMLDGYSEKSAIVITNGIKASVDREIRLAEFQSDDEEDNGPVAPRKGPRPLDNPLGGNEVTQELQDSNPDPEVGTFGGETETDEENVNMDDLDISEDEEAAEIGDELGAEEDLAGEEGDFIDNLPEGGDDVTEVTGNDINISIDTGVGDSVTISINPETGEVSVDDQSEEIDLADTDILSEDGEGEDRDELADEFAEDVDGHLDSLKTHVDDLTDSAEEVVDDEAEDFKSEDTGEDEEGEDEEGEGEDEGEEKKDELFKESDEPTSEEASEEHAAGLDMKGNMVLASGKMAGKYLDMDKIAEAIGLTRKDIKQGAEVLAGVHPFFRKTANVQLTKTPNIVAAMKTAQKAPNQTMPLDVEDDVDAGVPRDKSVGLSQTEPKKVEEIKGDNDVPRSTGNGGLKGGKKVDWAKETGPDATSGNPDTYVQTVVEQVKPTPAGNDDNHAVASSERDVIKAFAVKNNIQNPSDIEIADLGPFYIIAHNDRAFKLDKENYDGPELDGVYAANFEKMQIKITAGKKKPAFLEKIKNEDGKGKPKGKGKGLPFGGKQAKPFGSKGKDECCDDEEKKPEAKKSPKQCKPCTASMAKSAVAKKFNIKVANLEAKEVDGAFAVLDTTTNKVYKVRQ